MAADSTANPEGEQNPSAARARRSFVLSKFTRKELWMAWAVVTVCAAYGAMGVWNKSCACGYKTPDGVGISTVLALSAWAGLVIARRSPLPARVALAGWTLITSLLLGQHIAEAFFFSPHAPFK